MKVEKISFFSWLKHKLASLFYSKRSEFTLQKIMVIVAAANALLQVALGRIHNQAAYRVSSTVSIYTFIMQIALILTAVSLMRIGEKKRYYVYSGILFAVSIASGCFYIYLLMNDVYYQTALAGGYALEDCLKIMYAIEDSITFEIIALALIVVEIGLLIAEICIKRRRIHGLSHQGRD